MPAILWPRQEVLQLVIPQIANYGKPLSNEIVIATIKKLSKIQNPDNGKISFDRWLIAAKNILKWNDSCIHLFWDMMSLAVWYTRKDDEVFPSFGRGQEDASIDLNFLAIFLVLHMDDATAKNSSPAAAYDTFWPAAYMDESGPGGGSLSSPKSAGHGLHVKLPTTIPLVGSPKSPRSPKSAKPTSPKRTHLTSPRQSRTSAQHLHSLRQKLPLILKAISLEDFGGVDGDESFSEGLGADEDSFRLSSALDFEVSKAAFDSLRLIIAGGLSRETEISLLSGLHPALRGQGAGFGSGSSRAAAAGGGGGGGDTGMVMRFSSADGASVTSSEMCEWLDNHLTVNELIQPSSPTASGAFSPTRGSSGPQIPFVSLAGTLAMLLSGAVGLSRGGDEVSGGFGGTVGGGSAGSPVSTSTIVSNLFDASVSKSGGSDSVSSGGGFSRTAAAGGGGSAGSEGAALSVSGSATFRGAGLTISATRYPYTGAQQQPIQQSPCQAVSPVSVLSRTKPTVITNCTTTILHVVAGGPSRGVTGSSSTSSSSSTASGSMPQKKAAAVGAYDSEEMATDSDSSPGGSRKGRAGAGAGTAVAGGGAGSSGHMSVSEPNSDSNGGSDGAMCESAGNSDTGVGAVLGGISAGRHPDVDGDDDLDEEEEEGYDSLVGGFGVQSLSLGSGGGGGGSMAKKSSKVSNGATAVRESSIGSRDSALLCRASAGPDSTELGEDHGLPLLTLSNCTRATLYLLSAYSSGSISNCSDCEIVIGAVAGALVVYGCERVTITCACRKLMIRNCLECEFSVATLSPSVISGDSRSLVFGPYNASYRSLKMHLGLAQLSILAGEQAVQAAGEMSSMGTFNPRSAGPAGIVNYWHVMCEITSCCEGGTTSIGSPSGYAMDAADSVSILMLPVPPASTASLLAPEKMRFVSIPLRTEHQAAAMCPLPLPAPYVRGLQSRTEKVMEMQLQLSAAQAAASAVEPVAGLESSAGGDSSSGSDSAGAVGGYSPAVSKKFLEWLVASGKAQKVLDLVRMDAEKTGVRPSNDV